MANRRVTSKTLLDSVRLRYDLGDLPTTQHKAGLAGLVLQVESMRGRDLPAASIPILENVSSTAVEVLFTEHSIRGLFDDLYDAEIVEARSASKWAGKPPKREVVDAPVAQDQTEYQVDAAVGKTAGPAGARSRPRRWFIYDVVQPKGHFLRHFTADDKEIWHKLWRNMLWEIPRGKPTTRGPFNRRAEGKPSGEGEALWRELAAFDAGGRQRSMDVAGSVCLGAQAINAERVPFVDRVDQALLLHFWQLTVRVFVPEQVDGSGDRQFVGYLLAIPEVADLRRFGRLFKRALSQLDPQASGYRPRAALISLPEQGALEFMDNLGRLANQTVSELDEVADAVTAVEFFQMVKAGNNVKTMSHGHVSARRGLLTEYEGIRRSCRSALFLTGRLLALLRDRRWYEEFGGLMARQTWPVFVHSDRTPRVHRSFASDTRRRFEALSHEQKLRARVAGKEGSGVTQIVQERQLDTLVYRLVRNYVRRKTEVKSGMSYDSVRSRKTKDESGRERTDYPKPWVDAQEKVCSDLFLGFRSRHDDEFVSYFSATVGSVPQGSSFSSEGDFALVARALLDEERWQDVKTLAMLAVSASSYAPRQDKDHDQESEQ
jgi:CRISPR-associated protein Cmx8